MSAGKGPKGPEPAPVLTVCTEVSGKFQYEPITKTQLARTKAYFNMITGKFETVTVEIL